MKKVENLRDSSKLDPLIFSAFFGLLRKPAEQAPQTAALLRDGAARALMQLDRTSCLEGEAGSAKRIEKDSGSEGKACFSIRCSEPFSYSLSQLLRRSKEWFSRELEGGF